MRWVAKDAKTIFEEREFIDTLLIPIVPISLKQDGKEAANENEFIQLVTMQIEKQFKGRVFLMPPLTYFKTETEDEKTALYDYWERNIKAENFKHVFFMTSENSWQTIIHSKFKCIWIPSIPLEHLEDTYKDSIIESQVKQILNIFIKTWQKEERVGKK